MNTNKNQTLFKKNKSQAQVKQYFYWPAYTDNYHLMTVVDGKIEDDQIVAYHELCGAQALLEHRGYKKALLVQEAEIEFQRAEQTYNDAKAMLETARANAVQISDEEAMSHFFLSKYLTRLKGGPAW